MIRAIVAFAALAGCYHPTVASDVPCSAMGLCPGGQMCDFGRSPPTCIGGAPNDGRGRDGPIDAPVDGPPACTDNSSCSANAPICDPTSHTCRGCVADAECPGACTEYNGQCIADADTIYVTSNGVNTGTCISTAPCGSIDYALMQVQGTRRTVQLGDGTLAGVAGSPAATVNVTGGRVVLSGLRLDYTGGASLMATSNGVTSPVVVQTGIGTDVVIEGVTISNGLSDGIRTQGALLLSHVDVDNNNNRGLDVQTQSPIHIWSSWITNSGNEAVLTQNAPLEILRSVIALNTGGGINARGGAITIISSVIAGNGGANTNVGGVYLQSLNGNSPVLEFDTIAFNQTKANPNSPGLQADNSAAVAISNSIVCNNTAPNMMNPIQICMTCTASYTLFSGTPPIGTGNITGAPGFVSANDLHITAASAAHGMADPNANIHYDVDGETRPQGAPDMGADEIP